MNIPASVKAQLLVERVKEVRQEFIELDEQWGNLLEELAFEKEQQSVEKGEKLLM